MKVILLVGVLLCGHYKAAASFSFLAPADTLIDRPVYDLTHDEFLEKYGRDDSSKALINFFFKRRKPGAGMMGGGIALTVLGAGGLIVAVPGVNDRSNDFNQQLSDLLLAFLAAIALVAGIALASVGTALGIKYSKKRLLRLLDNYFAGTPKPRNIAKNIMFRAFVQYGEWNADTKRKIKSMDRALKPRQH
jgi:Zn-dependent protease